MARDRSPSSSGASNSINSSSECSRRPHSIHIWPIAVASLSARRSLADGVLAMVDHKKNERDSDLEPGAWERFERAVDAAVKSGPKHRATPKGEPAGTEIEELKRLLSKFPDAAVEVHRGLEGGLPLLRAKVVPGATETANGKIVGFELPEWLKTHLSALRARDFDPDEVVGGPG